MKRIKRENYKNKKRFSIILIFLLVFCSSRASAIFNLPEFIRICSLFSLVLYLVYSNFKNIKYLVLIFLIYISLFALQYFIFNKKDINLTGTINIFFNIIFGFCVINFVGDKFKMYFTNLIYYLALISIIFFIFQIIIPDPFFKFNRILQDYFPSLDIFGKSYSNSIIFTFRSPHWFRNCGFMWEPGGYGAILSIALFLSLQLSKFKITKKTVIFIIALITTFSTTSYLVLGIVIVYYLLNIQIKLKLLWLLPTLICVFIYAFNLGFIGSKINSKLNDTQMEVDQLNSPYALNQKEIPLDRFSSLVVQLQNVRNNLFFGIGLHEDSFKGIKLNLSNGLGDYLMKYGIFGILLFLFNLYKSSNYLNSTKTNGNFIFVIIIATIGFSNPLLLTPLFFLFQLYYLK